MSNGSLLLTVEKGQWGYRRRDGWFTPAGPVGFEVAEKEVVLLTGDNGSGKTTILRGLLGLTQKRTGKVIWLVDRASVAYVPQESVIDQSVPATALDIVRTGQPMDWGGGETRARKALAQVGIENKGKILYGSLSGGQRQRVLVARALVGDPQLLILDEPTVNVDSETASQIGVLLENLRQDGLGMVITSHISQWLKPTTVIKVESCRKELANV